MSIRVNKEGAIKCKHDEAWEKGLSCRICGRFSTSGFNSNKSAGSSNNPFIKFKKQGEQK